MRAGLCGGSWRAGPVAAYSHVQDNEEAVIDGVSPCRGVHTRAIGVHMPEFRSIQVPANLFGRATAIDDDCVGVIASLTGCAGAGRIATQTTGFIARTTRIHATVQCAVLYIGAIDALHRVDFTN